MTSLILPAEVDRFRVILEDWLGLGFDESRLDLLREVLSKRSAKLHFDVDGYLGQLEQRPPEERRALAEELTVTETYFFRNGDQLRAFTEVAVPSRSRVSPETEPLQIACLGCSSGEEPYTLAMLLSEEGNAAKKPFNLYAVDVNRAAIERGRKGVYSAWSLRETPASAQARWFHRAGSSFLLDESIRSFVAFEEHNLHNASCLPAEPRLDVVFCRNVLMYLTPCAARALVQRIARALLPGGFLFLGHAETLRGISSDFHLCHTHDAFYYQRKSELPVRMPAHASDAASPQRRPEPVASVVAQGAWFGEIQRATARIQALAVKDVYLPAGVPSDHGPAPRAGTAHKGESVRGRFRDGASAVLLQGVRALLIEERFDEARTALDGNFSSADPDVLLLRALLCTHGGELQMAADLCTQLLAVDELHAEAHYLMALCMEGLGDEEAAVTHDQSAIYLDSRFALPRLHLGRLSRRAGNLQEARRHLSLAHPLLMEEDSARLLLFGGGFQRKTLLDLCEAELSALELETS